MKCPACGEPMEDMECTNPDCPGREETEATELPVQHPGRVIAEDLDDTPKDFD